MLMRSPAKFLEILDLKKVRLFQQKKNFFVGRPLKPWVDDIEEVTQTPVCEKGRSRNEHIERLQGLQVRPKMDKKG